MTTLTLSVPEKLLRKASARLGKKRSDIHQFLLSSLEVLALDGKPIDRETERKVLEGLASPLIVAGEAQLRAKRRRYDLRQRAFR